MGGEVTPIERLMDPKGGCKRFAKDIAMHWWKTPAPNPGDTCQCGEIEFQKREDDDA